MASFNAGAAFSTGVANDVTADKLGLLITNATPTPGFIQDRTAESIIATNDTLLIGDASDSSNLKRMTVANFAGTLPTATITSGTITTLNSTTGTITTGVIPTLTSTTLITTGTGTAASPAIVPTGDSNTGIFFPAADTIAFSEGGTEAMRINSSGNVGIGTTSPTNKLHLYNGTNSVGATQLELEGLYNGYGAGINFSSRTSDGGTLVAMAKITADGEQSWNTTGTTQDAGLRFSTTQDGTLTERLRIDSSGNVGIGTSSPAHKLQVSGVISSNDTVQTTDGTTVTVMSIAGAGEGVIGTSSNHALQFRTNNTERLRIDSSGNVGVGTASPANKLEVVGSFGRGAPVTKTADFSLADTENWLIVNKGSSCTVTLPAASSWTGREFTIKVITAHAVVSATAASVVPRIGGVAGTAILPATDGAWATLVSNGTTWEIMCGS